MCACVWRLKAQKEFGINLRRKKVKKVRGMSASVMNSFLALDICARVSKANVLAYAKDTLPTMAYTYGI